MSAATEERALAAFAPPAQAHTYRRTRILHTAGRVVAFHSHDRPIARFLHHRAGGDDDLRPAALPPFL